MWFHDRAKRTLLARTIETPVAQTSVGVRGPAARLVKIMPGWQLPDEVQRAVVLGCPTLMTYLCRWGQRA